MLDRYLPSYEVQLVSDPNSADLIAAHAGMAPNLRNGKTTIAHSHGLYPTAYQDQVTEWHWRANQLVIDNIRGAKRITVPSQWVADIFRRDMHLEPDVIPWAIDLLEWTDAQPQGYVLWNKTRTDGVCSPIPVNQLARRVPNQQFVSTFAAQGASPNIHVTGRVAYDTMRQMVRGASIYLATTKETFGIGTLEAMACGQPVLGFRHGATPDLVEHGVNGYLVDPGDYDGLAEGLDYCLKYRKTLGHNARLTAARYTWDSTAERFAALYRSVLRPVSGPRVSIVIPLHNYAHYVEQAIASSIAQHLPDGSQPEIIVVNDGSTDDSYRVAVDSLKRLSPSNWLNGTNRVIDQENAGVAAARNAGIKAAKGEYIVCLDADDMIEPGFVDACTRSLDSDPTLGLVFTSLRMMDKDGTRGNVSNWPDGYDFDLMVQRHNQVPTCCMFRKEAWQRAGGYRRFYTPAEDADLWLRMGVLGYKAKHCESKPLFLYRLHEDSLSGEVRTGKKPEPNWCDKTWIADGQRPFASDGRAPFYSWPVRNYDRPKVSIIVPVGSYHTEIFSEALDSIENQSERSWECIVVNDSGKTLDLASYPWLKILDTAGNKGPSYARNVGLDYAKSPLVTFLDADDQFHPDFLRETLKFYALHDRYVYTDWISLNKQGVYETHTTPDYQPGIVFKQTSIHSINILIPRKIALEVGGFDEGMRSWEDTDFFMKLAAAGYCGVRCPKPLMLYRYTTGQLREQGFDRSEELKTLLRERYRDYVTGGKMPDCFSCGAAPKPEINMALAPSEGVRVQYAGPPGSMEVIGPATRRQYGRRQGGDIFYVFAADMQAAPKLFIPVIDPTEEVVKTPAPPPPQEQTGTPLEQVNNGTWLKESV